MDNKILQLRKFFQVTNATYNFINSVELACGRPVATSKMQQLHKEALEEIEKENPDLVKIDSLLEEMECLAELVNGLPNPKFPKGAPKIDAVDKQSGEDEAPMMGMSY